MWSVRVQEHGKVLPLGMHMETFGWGSQNNIDQLQPSKSLLAWETTTVDCAGTILEGAWEPESGEDYSQPHFFCAHASLENGGPCYGDNGGTPLAAATGADHGSQYCLVTALPRAKHQCGFAGPLIKSRFPNEQKSKEGARLISLVGVYVYYEFRGNDCLPLAGQGPILLGYLNLMAKPIREFIM